MPIRTVSPSTTPATGRRHPGRHLEELGDRVAVYGFRSHGRSAVHLPAIKPFGQPFGAGGRARLNQLQPAGYTRLGAGIRGAGEILKTEAGTPNRLLLVLSDGFPYDDGYEARYAEADAHKALEELRADGVACLCLSIGASTPTDALTASSAPPATPALGTSPTSVPHGRALPRRPQGARRTESARLPSSATTGMFRMRCPTDRLAGEGRA
jgi:hypothetical protein